MLTVGVVIHSQPDYSQYCIESIYRSSLMQKRQVEVVIVTNECDEETTVRIRELQKKYSFRLIRNHCNRGYAIACNQILRITQTPYVCFLHNDVIVTERSFECLINVLERVNEEIYLAIPRTNYANEHFPCILELRTKFEGLKPSNKELISRKTLDEGLSHLYGGLEDLAFSFERENFKTDIQIVEEISSFCQMFRTEPLRELGGFKEDFPIRGYEDKELLLRSTQKGFSIALCMRAFVHHHGNLTTDGKGFEYPAVMARNYEIYKTLLEKHKVIEQQALRKQVTLVTNLGSFRETLRKVEKKKKKRLLYFGSHYPPENAGGAELSFHNVAKQLLYYDIEVAAVTIRNRYHKKFDFHRSFNHEGVQVLQIPEENGEDLRQKLKLFIEQFQPDAVYAHSIWAYYVFELLIKEFPTIKRIFAFRHQTDITDGKMESLLRQDGGIVVLSNSKWMQKTLYERCGCDSELIYPAVYPQQCVIRPEEHERKAVVIGNGVISKGIKNFIAIARLLPNIEFQVYGTLDNAIPHEMIPHNVSIRNWVTDLREIYREAKILVNMSLDPEPYGRTLIEAMFNSIPVIAYNEGGPKEIVKQGGYLVETPDDFAIRIEELYSNEELYEEKRRLTQNDLALYNPYEESQKLVRLLLNSLEHSFFEEYCF